VTVVPLPVSRPSWIVPAVAWLVFSLGSFCLLPSALGADSPEVTLVGYNLRNYLPMDRRVDDRLVEDAPKPEKEVEALVSYLVEIGPDILGVCEIGAMAEVKDLQGRLRKAGVELPHVAWLEAHDEKRHLAVFSRYPIFETHSRDDLSFFIDGVELPYSRGIIDVSIRVTPDYLLRVVGVHLKSKRAIREADHNVIRRNEAALLRRHVDGILEADPEANVLVFGDFNATRNEIPMGIVRGSSRSRSYLRPIDLEDEDGERWTYYWNYGDQYSRFDFLLGSRGFMREVELAKSYILAHRDWYDASDHRPLVLQFVAEERGRDAAAAAGKEQ